LIEEEDGLGCLRISRWSKVKVPTSRKKREKWGTQLVVSLVLLIGARVASAQAVTFQFDPSHTTVTWTLGDVLHTVRGTFQLKSGSLQLDPASGKANGDIVVDAKSGQSGSSLRDRKMHREILESDRYPEIAFRPDHINGPVKLQGKSSVQVHGTFGIHGGEHELAAPAEVEISGDRWNATLHFAVPYENWGMKNPSTLFLKVGDSVQIDLVAMGSLSRH
jgi:polyisoprenoid-binding protein YceI